MPGDATHSDLPLHLLVVTRDAALLESLRAGWRRGSPSPAFTAVGGLAELRARLRDQQWDALLYCQDQAGCGFAAAVGALRRCAVDLPLIVVAAPSHQRAALRLLRRGAHDVVFLDRLQRLPAAVERAGSEAGQRADHHAALAMLHDSETRFRALAANLPGLVFNLQWDAAQGYRFLYVSEGALRLLGIPPHELRGDARRFFTTVEHADRQALEEALAVSARSGHALSWEGRLGDGERWIDMRSLPQRQDDGRVSWTGIVTDITRAKRSEAALRESRAQLAALSSHLEAVREEERERIARDIHDELGSILVRLKIEAALLASKLAGDQRPKARSIEALLDQAMGTASRVARQLRPGILKEFGLSAAIESQVDDFAHSTGIACRTQCDEGIELDDDTSLALFRIVQEALTNIAKHAHASLAVVRLRRENGNILLEIRDNGRGIAARDMDKPKSFGLRGIRERVQNLAGSFHIAPAEQGGTLLMLKVPERAAPAMPAESEEALQQDLF